MEKRFYTVEEIMELLQISRRVVYNLFKNGDLKVIKIGREYRVPAAALEAFLAKGSKNGR